METHLNNFPNQESFEAESKYIAMATQSLPSLSNDDIRITFDFFKAQSNLCPGNTVRMLHDNLSYTVAGLFR